MAEDKPTTAGSQTPSLRDLIAPIAEFARGVAPYVEAFNHDFVEVARKAEPWIRLAARSAPIALASLKAFEQAARLHDAMREGRIGDFDALARETAGNPLVLKSYGRIAEGIAFDEGEARGAARERSERASGSAKDRHARERPTYQETEDFWVEWRPAHPDGTNRQFARALLKQYLDDGKRIGEKQAGGSEKQAGGKRVGEDAVIKRCAKLRKARPDFEKKPSRLRSRRDPLAHVRRKLRRNIVGDAHEHENTYSGAKRARRIATRAGRFIYRRVAIPPLEFRARRRFPASDQAGTKGDDLPGP
ncbi:hypothetical protein [Paraburkholderia youngii]|uniref:hypothetical protein n=1 Tax=Paraburkholderia youngii TaxID=2782701 RepID=UPI003D1EB080